MEDTIYTNFEFSVFVYFNRRKMLWQIPRSPAAYCSTIIHIANTPNNRTFKYKTKLFKSNGYIMLYNLLFLMTDEQSFVECEIYYNTELHNE